MALHLLLRLEAPLMSFGTVAVDHRRPIQAWPATSMLTGLFANALGWTRTQAADLDSLQARLRWGARIDRAGNLIEDFQTAQLDKSDQGWTTRGEPDSRAGGQNTYLSPHLRYRDYRADASVLVALRLEPEAAEPTLEQLEDALDRPGRPLFIGRKGCPPAVRIAAGRVDARDVLEALRQAPVANIGEGLEHTPALYFNEGAATAGPGWITHDASDLRRFALDVHAGRQRVFEQPAKGAVG